MAQYPGPALGQVHQLRGAERTVVATFDQADLHSGAARWCDEAVRTVPAERRRSGDEEVVPDLGRDPVADLHDPRAVAGQPVVERRPPRVQFRMGIEEVEDHPELGEEVEGAPGGRTQDAAGPLA